MPSTAMGFALDLLLPLQLFHALLFARNDVDQKELVGLLENLDAFSSVRKEETQKINWDMAVPGSVKNTTY